MKSTWGACAWVALTNRVHPCVSSIPVKVEDSWLNQFGIYRPMNMHSGLLLLLLLMLSLRTVNRWTKRAHVKRAKAPKEMAVSPLVENLK